MYSNYTIIFVLLSWLNQPFLMVSWHFTRDEYLAGWGGAFTETGSQNWAHLLLPARG